MGQYGDRFSQAVAAELRAERVRKQITVATVVEDTGLSKSAVLHYLNGKRDIPTSSFAEICQSLGVDPREIFVRAQYFLEQDDRRDA